MVALSQQDRLCRSRKRVCMTLSDTTNHAVSDMGAAAIDKLVHAAPTQSADFCAQESGIWTPL